MKSSSMPWSSVRRATQESCRPKNTKASTSSYLARNHSASARAVRCCRVAGSCSSAVSSTRRASSVGSGMRVSRVRRAACPRVMPWCARVMRCPNAGRSAPASADAAHGRAYAKFPGLWAPRGEPSYLSLGYLCSRAVRARLPTNSTTADRLGESARRLRVGNNSFRGFYEPNRVKIKSKNRAAHTGRIYYPDFRVVAASFFSEPFFGVTKGVVIATRFLPKFTSL